MMHLAQISQALNGQLMGSDVALSGVTTDTRGSCHGELFVALKGDRFDAHDFVADAQQAGAAAVLIDHDVDSSLPKVLVTDTHQALKEFAAWWRAQFVIPVIGVTGSVGKTTVKEMLGCIFAEMGKGVVTKGNLNNEIGLPLTVLRLQQDDQYAILEMGMNHAGEISRLTSIAKPTIAMVNNAAAAHLEGLGTVEGVAKAKGEIFEGLSDDGVAVINADDQYVELWRELIGERQTVSFGLSKEADVTAEYQLTQNGLRLNVKAANESFKVTLATLGKHNVSNALAAIAVATSANIPIDLIQAGLSKYRPLGGRLNADSVGGVTLIDDTYNANPASMQAAIEVLAQYDNSILIVGDMGELGDSVEAAHRQVGVVAADNHIDHLYACGNFAELVASSFSGDGQSFNTQDALLTCLSDTLLGKTAKTNTAILVKGSRFARMENVVKHINEILKKAQTVQASGGDQ